MSEFVSAMALPFGACVVLSGIHAAFGLHVLERRVVFVDLALAQIAALGAVVGAAISDHSHGADSLLQPWSLAFVGIGAVALTFSRPRSPDVPHEAVVGVLYAVAFAGAILVGSRLPHGAEHLRSALEGSLLWIDEAKLISSAILYGVVGAVLFAFRAPFARASKAARDGDAAPARRWDLLFYALLGVVVTSSVGLGGVLLVFALLVVPAAIAMLVTTHLRARLAVAWGSGTLLSFVGLVGSYEGDLPSGPSVVVVLGAGLGVALFASRLRKVRTS